MLPEGYTLTKLGDAQNPNTTQTCLQAYRRWWLPDNAKGVCPLRCVDFSDFSVAL